MVSFIKLLTTHRRISKVEKSILIRTVNLKRFSFQLMLLVIFCYLFLKKFRCDVSSIFFLLIIERSSSRGSDFIVIQFLSLLLRRDFFFVSIFVNPTTFIALELLIFLSYSNESTDIFFIAFRVPIPPSNFFWFFFVFFHIFYFINLSFNFVLSRKEILEKKHISSLHRPSEWPIQKK